jgi:hypothetical protein
MTHGFAWVLDLFALTERTFPGYGLSHFSDVDFSHSRPDNSLTAPVCPARKAVQQDLGPQQDLAAQLRLTMAGQAPRI